MRAEDTIGRLRLSALDRMDALPRDLREVAHEIGLPIVEAFLQAGVTKPGAMRNIAMMFWCGAHGQPENRVGAKRHLDVMLLQAGGAPNAAALARLLMQNQIALLPIHPSARMVQASMDEVGRHGIISKAEKHRLRIKAALAEGAAEMWPEVFGNA